MAATFTAIRVPERSLIIKHQVVTVYNGSIYKK